MLKNSIKKETQKDIFFLYILFLISVVVIYKFPSQIGILFQIILFIALWLSKKDYFWLAFIFIVEASPGGFFHTLDKPHRLALLHNTPFGTLFFSFIFILIFFIKVYIKDKKLNYFILKNIFLFLVLYYLIQIFLLGLARPVIIRLSVTWLLFFSLHNTFINNENIHKFFNLTFSSQFLVLLSQMFLIKTGFDLSSLFGGSNLIYARGINIEESHEALRPVSGIFISFLNLFGSAYFLSIKEKFFKSNYLHIILTVSFLSIFLTATRSWLIASLILLLTYLYISFTRHKFKLNFTLFLIFIFLVSLFSLYSIPFIKKQVILATNRYSTIEYLIKGDITAGGTLQRFDVRSKKPVEGFKESPIIGLGVSKYYYYYSDGHVGFQNLIMSTGIIGFFLWCFIWFGFIFLMFKKYIYFNKTHPFKYTPLILISFLIGTLIIHSSAQWYGYTMQFNNMLIMGILYSIGTYIYKMK